MRPVKSPNKPWVLQQIVLFSLSWNMNYHLILVSPTLSPPRHLDTQKKFSSWRCSCCTLLTLARALRAAWTQIFGVWEKGITNWVLEIVNTAIKNSKICQMGPNTSPGLPFSGPESFYSGSRSSLLNSCLQNFFLRDQSFKAHQQEQHFPNFMWTDHLWESSVKTHISDWSPCPYLRLWPSWNTGSKLKLEHSREINNNYIPPVVRILTCK